MNSLAKSIRVVLLRPRNPENLGAIARAMKNFGLGAWTIVDPRTFDFASARRVAVHAEDLLDRPKIASTLDEAVADCTWVVATSSRRASGKRPLTPSQVAQQVLTTATSGITALVFGDERAGLTNAEIDRCHDLSIIPTHPAQPSINLAQAVLLYCYAIHAANLQTTLATVSSDHANSSMATTPTPAMLAADAQLLEVEKNLRETLIARGFITGPERHAVKDLISTLRRSRLSKREAKLWITALRSLGKRS